MKLNKLMFAPLALILAMGGICTVAQAADMPDSEQVSELLSQVKSNAFQLAQDSAILESYTGPAGSTGKTIPRR